MNTQTSRTDEGRTKDAKIAEYDDVIFILKKEKDGVYEGSTTPPKKWTKTGNVEFREERPTSMTTPNKEITNEDSKLPKINNTLVALAWISVGLTLFIFTLVSAKLIEITISCNL